MRRVGLISARAGEILDLAGRTLVTIPNTNPHGKVLAGIVQKSVLQILDDSYRLGSSPTLYREEAREVLAFINRIIPDLSARRPLSPVVEKIPQ